MLGFFLFDDRESQQVVAEFTVRQFSWLDGLARSAHMVLLFFGLQPGGSEDDDPQVLLLEGKDKAENPSLEVASKFGITASQLPGIVFFQDIDLSARRHQRGVYWPIDISLFHKESAEVERELSMLFSLVQRVTWNVEDRDAALEALRHEIGSSLNRRDRRRPVFASALGGAFTFITAPGKVFGMVSSTFTGSYGEEYPV